MSCLILDYITVILFFSPTIISPFLCTDIRVQLYKKTHDSDSDANDWMSNSVASNHWANNLFTYISIS